MVHYLGHIQRFDDGPLVEDWNEMVDGFDLDRFCDAVQEFRSARLTEKARLDFRFGERTGEGARFQRWR